MSDLPKYPPVEKPPVKKPEVLDPVAKSIAKPHAFAKPGTLNTAAQNKGTRFRPLTVKGKGRKRKADPRHRTFY